MCSAVFSKRLQELQWLDRILFKMLQAQSVIFSDGFSEKNPCPDKEMTLLDVLHICPELMSSDGKTLTANYVLSVDDIFLSVDYEPLLEGIKACDLSEVIVCTYGAVNNATKDWMGSWN